MAKPTFEALETKFTDWVNARAALDPRYAEVLDVYHWAKKHHTGVRDNGEPEFIHPLRLALKVASLTDRMEKTKGGYLPEALDLLKAAICHDILEDKERDLDTGAVMDRHFLGRKIGTRAADIVFRLSRKYINDDGVKVRKSKEEDHATIRSDPASLLLKHIDRDDNLGTMVYFTRDGIPRNVIYTPEKAKEKFFEAIQFLMQASLPERVEQNYGREWLRPMAVVSTDLLHTIEKVVTKSTQAFVRRTIYHKTDFGVSNLLADMAERGVFPEQLGDRPSKKGVLPVGTPVGTFSVLAGTEEGGASTVAPLAQGPVSRPE